MATYDSYKDSGVKWLGQIPSHWEIDRAKKIFVRHKRPVRPEDEIVTCFRDGQVTLRKNRRLEGFTNAAKEFGYQGIRKGDLVIHEMDAFAGSIGVSDSDGKSTPVYSVCTTRDASNNEMYYAHIIRVMAQRGFIQSLSKGIRERSTAFSYDIFGALLLPIPPFAEQEAMVAYLDKVTGEIDRAIEAQQKMIDALNERKQIIITRAFPQQTESWDIIPFRHVFEMRGGYTPSKADYSLWENGTIPWYRMEDIRKSGRFLNEAIQYVNKKAVKAKGPFKAGSYIMAICTASIGEHAMLIADSLANQQFANLKIRKSLEHRLSPMFIFYYLYVVGDFCRNNANSTCFQYVDMEGLKKLPVPIPTITEQDTIVKQLERDTKNLTTAIANCERMIALLTERKQIIINEVVTGKKKVI